MAKRLLLLIKQSTVKTFTGGFAANPALAKIAGAKGGRVSKRGKAKKNLA